MKPKRKQLMDRMLALIEKRLGIRAQEINKALGIEHSWPLRKKLIEQGRVKKERDGAAVRYYPK